MTNEATQRELEFTSLSPEGSLEAILNKVKKIPFKRKNMLTDFGFPQGPSPLLKPFLMYCYCMYLLKQIHLPGNVLVSKKISICEMWATDQNITK